MNPRPSTLSSCLAIVGGVAILGFGIYHDGDALGLRDRAARVEGTVVGISAAHGERTVGKSKMTTQFTRPDGKILYVDENVANGEHHLGEKVALLVDPETGAAVTDSWFGVYGALLWFGTTGTVLVAAGALSLLGARPGRR